MSLIEMVNALSHRPMNTQDWNDLLFILERRELELRQRMESDREAGREFCTEIGHEYRKVCTLQVRLANYVEEASKV